MEKLREILSVHDMVFETLKESEVARNSDMALYIELVKKINPAALSAPFSEVLLGLRRYGLPHFETVRRTRQKIQADHLELCGTSDVEAHRLINEIDFEKYTSRKRMCRNEEILSKKDEVSNN